MDSLTQISNFFSHIVWPQLLIYLLLSTLVLGNLATYCRKKRKWEDGYSRKLNHFGHMVISLPLLAFLPEQELIPTVFMGAILVTLIYAISAWSSKPILAGIVAGGIRERDKPNGRFFFFMPLITGNIALVIAVFLFPADFVRIAFFTGAFADGLAEPVGLKWGRNSQFHIKDYVWKTTNTKSLHGSANVFFWSTLSCLGVLVYSSGFSLFLLLMSLSYGAILTITEMLAPRGMDNMLIFLVGPIALVVLSSVF